MMNYSYYVVNKANMSIIDGADNLVSAYNQAEKLSGTYIILQGCVISEVEGTAPQPNSGAITSTTNNADIDEVVDAAYEE